MSIFMSLTTSDLVPQPEETLAQYVVRLRNRSKLSQIQVSQAAGIHRQSLGKIENGQTLRLNYPAASGRGIKVAFP